jgi:hypothetical protein
MPEYFAENHDWDLTLRAAWSLLMLGQTQHNWREPISAREKEFSCLTGSMLLSFCAIESFSASIAFSMPREARFKNFDYDQYRKSSRFWTKIELIFGAIPYAVDKSRGLFQMVGQMQEWRNLVTHSSPYEIAKLRSRTRAPTR